MMLDKTRCLRRAEAIRLAQLHCPPVALLAEQAGISRATAYRALKLDQDVKASTAERFADAVETLLDSMGIAAESAPKTAKLRQTKHALQRVEERTNTQLDCIEAAIVEHRSLPLERVSPQRAWHQVHVDGQMIFVLWHNGMGVVTVLTKAMFDTRLFRSEPIRDPTGPRCDENDPIRMAWRKRQQRFGRERSV